MFDTLILQLLACPWDHTGLRIEEPNLVCQQGHSFAFEGDVPVFTDQARRELIPANMGPCRFSATNTEVDPFVNDWIVNTNGNLYRRARGRLPRYPIPSIPLGGGEGKLLVDIGCGWGRWSVAASRAGFKVIGADVHLDALLAAQRVSRQLGARTSFVCSPGDHLPLKSASADAVFSYGVLQHLERERVRGVLREAARVLKPGGTCLLQLPNRFGPLALLRQVERGFRDGRPGTFEMRYWSRREILLALQEAGLRLIALRADGYLTVNPQVTDLDLLAPWGKFIVLASHTGCRLANSFPTLARIADSLWIEARAGDSARSRP